tara:strand:+ start:621 stop:848 length:228 start_codon:yes stop_codon:yes gene_type:complete
MNKPTDILTKLKQMKWNGKLAIHTFKDAMARKTNPKALGDESYLLYVSEIKSIETSIKGIELAIEFIRNEQKKEG